MQFPFIFIPSASINRLLSSVLDKQYFEDGLLSVHTAHAYISGTGAHTLSIPYRAFADEYLSSIIQMKKENWMAHAECRYVCTLFAFPSTSSGETTTAQPYMRSLWMGTALNNCNTKYMLESSADSVDACSVPHNTIHRHALFFPANHRHRLAERWRDFAEWVKTCKWVNRSTRTNRRTSKTTHETSIQIVINAPGWLGYAICVDNSTVSYILFKIATINWLC